MINVIVIVVTIIAAGLLLVWILRPGFRKWVERPKYTMLENDQRFRDTEQPRDETLK
jgi:hypothetical protein